jgi:ribosome-binding factor A
MGADRMRRVDEAIRQVIGGVVAGELKDPRVGFVTVTDVRTSADLSHARVYVSVLGDEQRRADSLDGLRSAHGYLQRRVAGELRLKRTPTLTFAYDDTTDRALRVDALLEGGAAGQGPAGRDGDSRRRRVSPGFGRAPLDFQSEEIEGT